MKILIEMTDAICGSNRDTLLALACVPIGMTALGLFFCGWAP